MQIISQEFDTALTIDNNGDYICLSWQTGNEADYRITSVELGPHMDYTTWKELNDVVDYGTLPF